MFEQLAASENLRGASPLPSHTYVPFDVFDRRTGSIAIEVVVSGRTTGSVTAVLQASFNDGQSYPAEIATTGTLSTNRWAYLLPAAPLPPLLRLSLTPAGGFDGNVQIRLRAAGLTED